MPTAYTGEATEITTSSAVLQGSVYPSGQVTNYYFQYGPTAAYGAQLPTTVAGSGTASIHVAVPVAGLAPATSYHYRLVAVNGAGTALGQDRTFSTHKIPLTFTLAAFSRRHAYGAPFVIAGTLTGTESVGREVVLQANPFPYLGGFKTFGVPQQTDANGNFSFHVPGLPKNAQLRVATLDTPAVTSRIVTALIAVRVTLHVRATGRRGFVLLYGAVLPAQPGAQVTFQFVRSHHRPRAIAGTIIGVGKAGGSRFARVVRIFKTGLYRAVVYVVSGAQVSDYSRSVRVG